MDKLYTPRRCVITLGISEDPPSDRSQARRDFRPGIERLEITLINAGYEGDFMYWDSDYPSGSPSHRDIPYAFKPFCFREAAAAGADLILWLDSTIQVLQPIDRLFAEIEERGYLLFREDHSVGEYCKDNALVTLALEREQSFSVPSCWACAIGLDLRSPRSCEFLNEWTRLATDGVTFPGPRWSGVRGFSKTASADPRVKGHRHDQTAASVLALRLGMTQWKSKHAFSQYFKNERRWVPTLPTTGSAKPIPAIPDAGDETGDAPIDVLFFSRGRGRGHAIPDIAIVDQLRGFGTLNIQFVSYSTGADTFRAMGWSVIDLALPEANPFLITLATTHALIRDLHPTVVIAHEEPAVLVAAKMAGIPSILVTDWFPAGTHVSVEAVTFADSIVFLGEPGTFSFPANLRRTPIFVGPVIRPLKYFAEDREECRRLLEIPETAFVIAVIPGAWATEARSPIADTVLSAFAQLPLHEKCLFWLTNADFELISGLSTDLDNVRVMRDCEAVEMIMAASDIVLTKGNRGTAMDAAAVGTRSISLSHGLNPVDDMLVTQIRSNKAFNAKAVNGTTLAAHLHRLSTTPAGPGDRPQFPLGGAYVAAEAIANEINRLTKPRPEPVLEAIP